MRCSALVMKSHAGSKKEPQFLAYWPGRNSFHASTIGLLAVTMRWRRLATPAASREREKWFRCSFARASCVPSRVYRRTQGFANSSPDVECWRVIIAHLWVCITLLHLALHLCAVIHSSIHETLRLAVSLLVQLVSSRIIITVKATGRIHSHVRTHLPGGKKKSAGVCRERTLRFINRQVTAGWKLTQPPAAAAPTFSHQPSYKYN